MKLKKGDNVIVITGKNKGQKGHIAEVLSNGTKVILSGVNKVKKHLKPKTRDQKGTTIEVEAAIHASNVMVLDPKSGKATRIAKKKIGEKMVRIARKSGEELK